MTKRMLPIYFILISAIAATVVVTSGLVINAIDKSFTKQIYQMNFVSSPGFYLRIMDETLPGPQYFSNEKSLITKFIETVFGFAIFDPISLIKSEIPTIREVEIRNDLSARPLSQTTIATGSIPVSSLPDEVPVAAPFKASHAVFIYHTHSRESWIDLVDNPSSPFHETKNITLVGKHFAERLEKIGIPVIYDATDHDGILLKQGIHRSKAYDVSAETVKQALKQNPNIQYIFDFHRDAVDRQYTTTTIDGVEYAKIMFVIGKHNDNWEQNFAFAEKLQQVLEERFPGIVRPIATYENDRSHNGRYNQKFSDHALTIEIGGMENTLEEAMRTVEILADVFAELYLDAIPVYSSEEGR